MHTYSLRGGRVHIQLVRGGRTRGGARTYTYIHTNTHTCIHTAFVVDACIFNLLEEVAHEEEHVLSDDEEGFNLDESEFMDSNII
jgi:hypothetical protein